MSNLDEVHVGSPSDGFPSSGFVQTVHFHDFANLEEDEEVESPAFECAGENWRLNGKKHRSYFLVSLVRLMPSKMGLKGLISVKTISGHLFEIHSFEIGTYQNNDIPPKVESRFKLRGEYLNHGALTLEVRIQPENEHYDQAMKLAASQQKTDNIFHTLFLSNESKDIAFETKDKVFLAHRIVIESRAPAFAELCESYSKSKPMPVNVETSIFEQVIRFLYGMDIGTVDWESQANNLLDETKKGESIVRIAGRFGLNSLQAEAEVQIIKLFNLEVNNAIDVLVFADGKHLPHLKNLAIDFIVDNSEDVFKSESYPHLVQSNSLQSEVMLAMSKKISERKRKFDSWGV